MASALSSPRGARISALTSSSAARASTTLSQALDQRFLLRGGTRFLAGVPDPPGRRQHLERGLQAGAKLSFSGGGAPWAVDKDRGIGEDPRARQIAVARQFFAPHGDGLGAGAGAGASCASPRSLTHACAGSGSYSSGSRAPGSPPRTQCSRPSSRSRSDKSIGDVAEIQDIVRRVFQLCPRQRPLRPVGARLALGDAHVEQGLDEFGVADLRLESDAPRGDLRVEHRSHDRAWW